MIDVYHDVYGLLVYFMEISLKRGSVCNVAIRRNNQKKTSFDIFLVFIFRVVVALLSWSWSRIIEIFHSSIFELFGISCFVFLYRSLYGYVLSSPIGQNLWFIGPLSKNKVKGESDCDVVSRRKRKCALTFCLF